MSSDFAHSSVSYTSISSEARSWSILTLRGIRAEEDPEEDPTDHPTDGGDDDDESSRDDADDEDEEEASEEEEEEHLASADSSTVPTVDPVPSAKDT
ncbi:hypothetical protein Tco_1021665 [Tanacetum coccineum]